MPWIQPDSHRRVYDALRAGARIARPFYQGQPGHPVGFAAEFGERLLTLRGDEGARRLIAAVPGALQGCPVDDPGVLRDVDTPAALDAAVPCFAGSRELRVDDAVQGVSFPVVALYPTHTASETRRFGPYLMDTAADAPIAAGRFPLVAISHGTGGSHLLYRSLATHLAQNGYVVALIEHPGNNRNDNALAGSDENLLNRPRHVRLALDAVAGATALAGSVDGGQAAVIGHSLGGYTALALAGGIPWTQSGRRLEGCPDARIRALVLLAPATAWYGHPDSLKQVSVPILMLSAEHDAYTPGWHADIVRNGVPERARVSSRVVAKAGHFSFLSPFPPALRNPTFLPSTDPEGFDREAFHAQLPGEVLRFLDRVLKDRRPS